MNFRDSDAYNVADNALYTPRTGRTGKNKLDAKHLGSPSMAYDLNGLARRRI